MNMLFFVHIPKTAGTSFRIGAADYFGDEYIYADYGVNSPETSGDIRTNLYESTDLFNIKVLAENKGIGLLTGHVGAEKYKHIVVSSNIVTFLRHPVAQVISHYEHYVRHKNFDKKLEDFIVERRFTNLQFRSLRGLPIELFGYLGVTERYIESIDLFNFFYDVDFKKLSLNTKNSKGSVKPMFNSIGELDQKIFDLIAEHNPKDMKTYQLALDIFDERYRMFEMGHKYVMGFIDVQKEDSVSGVACSKDSQEAVELEVYLNGHMDGECRATGPRSHLSGLNVPRGGYIGFTYDYSRPLKEEDDFKVVVKATGQILQQKG